MIDNGIFRMSGFITEESGSVAQLDIFVVAEVRGVEEVAGNGVNGFEESYGVKCRAAGGAEEFVSASHSGMAHAGTVERGAQVVDQCSIVYRQHGGGDHFGFCFSVDFGLEVLDEFWFNDGVVVEQDDLICGKEVGDDGFEKMVVGFGEAEIGGEGES